METQRLEISHACTPINTHNPQVENHKKRSFDLCAGAANNYLKPV
jgi:hypothetical protein